MYKVGQNVVYPMHGVGKINSIEKKKILEKATKYYIIKILQGNIKIMVPVDKADEIGLRAVIDKREVNKILKILGNKGGKLHEDWKTRYQNNTDKIKTGSIYDIAQVVRDLNNRNKEKELSLMERKMYESALNQIITEISIAKKMTYEEAEKMVNKVLP
ncbi:MAG: transcriptional regulator [Spirochaetes bacterium]|nr:transcriptional regulator [Spirochaetota bacterium]